MADKINWDLILAPKYEIAIFEQRTRVNPLSLVSLRSHSKTAKLAPFIEFSRFKILRKPKNIGEIFIIISAQNFFNLSKKKSNPCHQTKVVY